MSAAILYGLVGDVDITRILPIQRPLRPQLAGFENPRRFSMGVM